MAFPNGQQTSVNSELFANLVTAAQFQAYEQSVARQLVTIFDAPNGTGKTLQIPVWSSVSANIITDEDVAPLTQTNTNTATLNLTEHVVYHSVTDMLRDSSYSDVMTALGDQSGRAIAESMDTQAFAQFTNFGVNVGGSGEELTVERILRAVAILRSNKLTGPFFAVVHPRAAYNVKKELALAGGSTIPSLSNVGEGVLSNFYIGQVAGCMVYESSLVPQIAGDAINGVFAPSAIGHAMRGAVSMETQRQAAARATDIVVKAVAGAATINAAHGVMIRTDITMP
jgi:hypothetical protein